VWQIGVVPMVALLLAAVTVVPQTAPEGVAAGAGQPAASGPRAQGERRWSAVAGRLAFAAAGLLAIVLIAVPLASTVEVRNSQADAARGRLGAALDAADAARAIEPGAASPYLQRALLLEQEDRTADAAVAIEAAIRREPNYYALWLIASRIATEQDRPREATADYARAQALFPTYRKLTA
jgi:tetratricopeptide (TPR) repeat protein